MKLRDIDAPSSGAVPDIVGKETPTTTTVGGSARASAGADAAMFDSDEEGGDDKAEASSIPAPVTPSTATAAPQPALTKGKSKGKGKAADAQRIPSGPKTVEVEFDLALSAHANARKMYAQKKVAYAKEVKTVEASAKVLQQVGDRVLQGVENQKLKRNLRAARKVST